MACPSRGDPKMALARAFGHIRDSRILELRYGMSTVVRQLLAPPNGQQKDLTFDLPFEVRDALLK